MRHIADRFTVVLDADVLYPFLVRDVLLSLAHAGLFRARWSVAIMDEWQRALVRQRPDREAKIRATAAVMNDAFPEALVEGFEALTDSVTLPDPDDRHVVAAAIKANAQHIITSNVRDYPEAVLAAYDIDVRTPDEFVVGIFELYPAESLAAIHAMRERYNAPPIAKTELLSALATAGLPKTAAALKPHMDAL